MIQQPNNDTSISRRFALCIGIEQYTRLANRNLRFAVTDALAVANRLKDPQWGDFDVTVLTEPAQTTREEILLNLDSILNGQHLNPEDIVVIYLSCHGDVYGNSQTFYLLPSNTELEQDGRPKKLTVIDIHDLTKILAGARVKNIIFLLDACHSGGAGVTLQQLSTDLKPDTNLFIVGSARHDQVSFQTSRLAHGIFTNCLLQAFEQKPSRSDGWLTISEIQSYITEAIRSYGKESGIQIQAWSFSVNPNLPFIKNPHYSPQSLEFQEKVKKLLSLLQYEPIEIIKPKRAPIGFYIAEIKSGLRLHRVGIIPWYNQVEPLEPDDAREIIHFVKEQIEEEFLDEGLLVTELEVSNEVKRVFDENGSRYLEIRTYESIWRNLIDFKKYLHKLIHDYDISLDGDKDIPLAQIYVPLEAERRNYEPEHNPPATPIEKQEKEFFDKTGKKFKLAWEGDLENEVLRWLTNSNPTDSRLALLADYGSGKSTFCQHMAATLARDYVRNHEHEMSIRRIPLLIPLLEFAKAPVDLETYLEAHLKRHCKVGNPDSGALMKMAEAGLLFFMLDGFDEMASRATMDTIRQNIAMIESLAKIPQNKVLITTRPEYFMNLSQEQKVLRSYPSLYLKPFNERQINLYLQKRVPFISQEESKHKNNWQYYRQQIDMIHDLSDLASRPVLLEMIIKTLPVLIAEGELVNRPNLYQYYLEGELDRQLINKHRQDLLIDRQKRFEIMEQIAVEMYRTDEGELTSEQIRGISRHLLTMEQQEEMEASLREILTCSFLIRVGNGYRFSHQSFQEFLVACHIAKDIMAEKPEIFRLRAISYALRDFLLELEVNIIQANKDSTIDTNINVSFDRKKLEDWFLSNPKDLWVSSNAIELLARLLPYELLSRLPLEGANLTYIDLTSIDLRGINFTNTTLSDADLRGADLSGADLSNSNLQDVDLRGGDLSYMELQGVDLSGANLSYAELSNANLSRANLIGTDLTCADLSRADLSRADLRNADLRRANLSDANLRDCDLMKADIRDANLDRADLYGTELEYADGSGVPTRRSSFSDMYEKSLWDI